MAHSVFGPASWTRLIVFSILVAALAAVPVRGCANSDSATEATAEVGQPAAAAAE
jgi:hypothetical protein